MEKKKEDGMDFKTERMTILGGGAFLIICQLLLCFLLIYEVFYDVSISFRCFPNELQIVLARFICGTVLHFNL